MALLRQKGDMAGYEAGMYEALGMIDPSCAVRDPKQPDGFYDAQRVTEERANKAKLGAGSALRTASTAWRPTK